MKKVDRDGGLSLTLFAQRQNEALPIFTEPVIPVFSP